MIIVIKYNIDKIYRKYLHIDVGRVTNWRSKHFVNRKFAGRVRVSIPKKISKHNNLFSDVLRKQGITGKYKQLVSKRHEKSGKINTKNVRKL